MKLSALVFALVVAGLLKLVLGLKLLQLWRRHQANHPHGAPADARQESTPIAPQLIFVPRLDPGRQMVIDTRGGQSFELAYHMDPGTQYLRYHDRLDRVGAAS